MKTRAWHGPRVSTRGRADLPYVAIAALVLVYLRPSWTDASAGLSLKNSAQAFLPLQVALIFVYLVWLLFLGILNIAASVSCESRAPFFEAECLGQVVADSPNS